MNHAPKKPEAQSEIAYFFYFFFASSLFPALVLPALLLADETNGKHNQLLQISPCMVFFGFHPSFMCFFLCIAAHLRCRGRASQPYSSAAPKGDRENANNRKVEKTH